jgi:hypothetical protein
MLRVELESLYRGSIYIVEGKGDCLFVAEFEVKQSLPTAAQFFLCTPETLKLFLFHLFLADLTIKNRARRK